MIATLKTRTPRRRSNASAPQHSATDLQTLTDSVLLRRRDNVIELDDKREQQRISAEAQRRFAKLAETSIEYIPNDKFVDCEPQATLSEEVVRVMADASTSLLPKKRITAELGTPLARACEMPLLTATEERGLFERMNYVKHRAHTLREQFDEQQPDLKMLDEIDRCLDEASHVRNRIIGANVRLVISIVKTFVDLRTPFDELVSEGILTMMHAVEKFDYDRGFRFSTYATRAIRRNLYRLLQQRQKERSRYANTGSEATLEVADDRNMSAIGEKRWEELQRQMKRMLGQLDPRERLIIRARFGMEKSGKVQTLQALARSLGVCKERVRQLEKRALEKLQKMVEEVKLEEAAEIAN